MTTIQKLWHGELYPCEFQVPITEQTREIESLIQRLTQKLSASLNQEQKDVFEKYVEAVHEREFYVLEHIFTEGFSLGSKLTAEALTK